MDRFIEKLDRSGEHWIWRGAHLPRGYGLIGLAPPARKNGYTHRVAFELFVRPLKAGEQVNHTCDIPACCRPEHLYAGTQSDNMTDRYARTPRPTHCRHGHLYTDANSIWRGNSRECRTCGVLAQRRYKARQRVALI